LWALWRLRLTRYDRHVVSGNRSDGVEFLRSEQAPRYAHNDWDYDWRVLYHFRDDGDRRAAKFDRKRPELSRFKYFSVREISGQHRCRWRNKEEVSKPARYQLPAGAALLRIDAGKRARDLSQVFRLRIERSGSL